MKKNIFLLSFFIAFSCSEKDEILTPNSSKVDLYQNSISIEQSEIEDVLNSKPFRELMDFNEKFVAKKIKNNDNTKKKKNIDFNDFEATFSKAKNKNEIKQALLILDDNPDELYDYIDFNVSIFNELNYFAKNKGKDEQAAQKLIISAFHENAKRKIDELRVKLGKNAKYDCSFACSVSFSISEANAYEAFAVNGALCGAGAGLAAGTGMGLPVAAAGWSICMAGVSYNWWSSFNTALQQLDICSRACGY
ncbi:MAG: hypothetical protein CFE22_12260 [Cytophagaceae bacterium BCCC1]|nr:MAG: hypothetical protein CFE22_12260 [Cytophagaceae bacterium BCCC1]